MAENRRTLVLALTAVLAVAVPCSAQDAGLSEGYDRCKSVADEKLRLQCFDRLVRPEAKGAVPPSKPSPWRLVRTREPQGDRELVSITRTADIFQSDPELAGLMIRCSQKADIEVLAVLLQPLSLRSHPTVTVSDGNKTIAFPAKVAAPGALVLLPEEASDLANGTWQQAKLLDVTVEDPELHAHGMIPLDGLSLGLTNLRANCPSAAP